VEDRGILRTCGKEADMKKYRVVIEWSNDRDGFDGDADEIVVFAEAASEAVAKAKARWRKLNEGIFLNKAWILTPERLREFL
jgi:hypothetical protein